ARRSNSAQVERRSPWICAGASGNASAIFSQMSAKLSSDITLPYKVCGRASHGGIFLGEDEMIRTRLTETLGIEHPVMLAGMGGVSYHRLVAAVSEAGGFGSFGAATMSIDQMVGEIAELKKLTSKPFSVDLLTAAGDMTAQCSKAIDEGASVFVAGLGVPV